MTTFNIIVSVLAMAATAYLDNWMAVVVAFQGFCGWLLVLALEKK